MKYRVIDAPGYGSSRSNKITVYSRHRTGKAAVEAAQKAKGRMAQESVSGEFANEAWDWMDWAHSGGQAAGHLRNL